MNNQVAILNTSILDALEINYFIVLKDRSIEYCNDAMRKIIGDKTHEDIDSKSWQNSLEVMETRKIKTIQEQEYNGQRWFLTKKAPMIDEAGNVTGVIGISEDITEQKRAELAKLNFLRNINHDIRTALTGIQSCAEYLSTHETVEGDEEVASFVNDIGTSASRLNETLHDALKVTELGQSDGKPEVVSLSEIINKNAEILKCSFRDKQITLNVTYPRQDFVTVSKKSLSDIVLNLLSNAVKFTDKGKINVTVEAEPLRIEIEDTGIGIAPENHDLIFDNFTKLKPSGQSQTYTGCGTGLYIAQAKAKQLGGHIRVESELGKGAKFIYEQAA